MEIRSFFGRRKNGTKALATFLVVSIMTVSVGGFLFTQKASAKIASCAANFITAITGSKAIAAITGSVPVADAKTQLNTGQISFAKCVIQPLAIIMAKTMVRNMGQSIVNWVNGGFDGNPAFVTDLAGTLRDVADETIGEFIERNPGLNMLCNDFGFQVRIALATKYYGQREVDQYRCTLSDIERNISTNGGRGWDRLLSVTAEPQNNSNGAFLIADSELTQRINNAVVNKSQRIALADGFLDFEKCETDTEVRNRVSSRPLGGDDSFVDGDSLSDSQIKSERKCTTVTPGKVIESQLNQTLGSWALEIGLATEIDQIVSALVNKLAQEAITGAGGLLGVSKKSRGSGSYRPLTYDTAIGARDSEADDPRTPLGDVSRRVAGEVESEFQVTTEIINIPTSSDESTPIDPVTPATEPTTVAPDDGSPTLAWSPSTMITRSLSQFSPLNDELRLVARTASAPLTAEIRLLRNGVVVPFLSVFDDDFDIMRGFTNGTLSSSQSSIVSSTGALRFSMSMSANTSYRFILRGGVRVEAPRGNYRFEARALDQNGAPLQSMTTGLLFSL